MVPARGRERNEATSDEGNALAARTMGIRRKRGRGEETSARQQRGWKEGENCILLLLAVFAGRGERGLLTYRMLLVVRSRRGRKIHQLLFMLSFLLPASPALSCTRKRNREPPYVLRKTGERALMTAR